MQNLSSENEFDLHENKYVRGIHLHLSGFSQRLEEDGGRKVEVKGNSELAY